MVTASLIGLPLVFGLLLLFTKGDGVKRIALAASVIELVLCVVAYYLLQQQQQTGVADARLFTNESWINSIEVRFHVALNGISMVMVFLTCFLVPLIILSGFGKKHENPSLFYALIMFMQMALIGVFTAQDGFLFYVFWELALIPIYFICLMWGGENRAPITFKFFVYTLGGSLFMLASFIYLYLHTSIGDTHIHTFNLQAMIQAGHGMSLTEQSLVFWGILLAFAVKMPIFPFHTWQPDTYHTAPTQGTMLLSGIMLKMGTFGMLVWLLPMTPRALEQWGPTVVVLSIISIVYASLMAIAQKDFKRMIAYSSIAHVGLIAAGIMAINPNEGNTEGITGSIVQMFAHGINVVGLFLIADIIFTRMRTFEFAKLGGIRNINPKFTSLFLIIMMGAVALPLTNGFVGEFLLITGVYKYSAIAAGFAGLTIILGAVYMLRGFQSIMLGETKSDTSSFTPLTTSEGTVLAIIAAAVIFFGVYPKPVLDLIQNDVQQLVESLKAVHP
jgi:NADH-quinone oxidoreductase subunit M